MGDRKLLEMAAKLVKAPGWRWLPGMQAVKDATVLATLASDDPDPGEVYRMVVGPDEDDDRALWCNYESDLHLDGGSEGDAYETTTGWWMDGLKVPDLTDRATVLLLIDLVREAWGDDGATTAWDGAGRWYIDAPFSEALHDAGVIAPTEVEALVDALLKAPPRAPLLPCGHPAGADPARDDPNPGATHFCAQCAAETARG